MGVTVFPEVGFLPGMVMSYAGATAPDGWLLCDGAAVSRTTYAQLFAILGTTYGVGDGSTTFNVPNMKGKVIVGVDAGQTEFNARAVTGGSKASTAPHTHDLAAHTHTLGTHTHTLSSHTHALATHDHSLSGHTHGLENHIHTVNAHSHGGGTGVHAHTSSGQVGTTTTAHDHHGVQNQFAAVPGGANYFTSESFISTNSVGAGNSNEAPNTGNPFNWGGPGGPSNNTAGGAQNVGGAQGPSTNTSGVPTGGSDGPSSNVSGAASAAVASGNLQPYLTMHYLIKT